MEFLRARTKEQIEHRQLDIIKACNELFETGGYDNVNIKAISEMTAITRSAIYTYYKTKDEIILDLLEMELLDWQKELLDWQGKGIVLNVTDFCEQFTDILLMHEQMLKHYSLLYTSLEMNCRIEKLIKFKKKAIPVSGTIVKILMQNFNKIDMGKAVDISEQMMAYILGLYPSSHITNKQKEALKLCNMGYKVPDFRTLCISGFKAFLETF